MLATEFIPYSSEAQFLGYIRANHLPLFPNLLSQSQFNRRSRQLRGLIEELRQYWLQKNELTLADYYLLDTKPMPVMGYKRSKKHSQFSSHANYGYCSSRKFYYFGYKLVMITTPNGIPMAYDLVSANTDERQAVESVLSTLHNSIVLGDKGFLDEEWQAKIKAQTGNRILTPKRKNQEIQHPSGFEPLLNSLCERIEGVSHEIQNTGRHLEHLLAKTINGLVTRVAEKMTSHLLRRLLRTQCQIDVQTFQAKLAF